MDLAVEHETRERLEGEAETGTGRCWTEGRMDGSASKRKGRGKENGGLTEKMFKPAVLAWYLLPAPQIPCALLFLQEHSIYTQIESRKQ